LGLPALVFALVALTTDTFSDLAAFTGLVVVSTFYWNSRGAALRHAVRMAP